MTIDPAGEATELLLAFPHWLAACVLLLAPAARCVLLLRDRRGRQWQRVPCPETVDLTGITATSARDATVVVADGRRFVTDDGGVTWVPVR